MRFDDFFTQYHDLTVQLLQKQKHLSDLPDGYISEKKISGKSYSYLQKRVNGKMQSRYLSAEEVSVVRQALSLRNQLQEDLDSLSKRIEALEKAAKILDSSLLHQMISLKQCMQMDHLPVNIRKSSLSFANAMLALEGVVPKPDAISHLVAWSEGRNSFSEGYQAVLNKYKLAVGHTL
jgi:hypothetical protein